MTKHLRLIGLAALAAFLVLVAVRYVRAQNPSQYVIGYTTLSAAQTASATTLSLTSASARAGSSFGAPAAGQCAFVDHELENIVSISGTTATVTRQPGAPPTSHASGAMVFTAPCDAFKQADPPYAGGGVTCANQPTPWINVANGNIWICGFAGSGAWSATNAMPITYNSVNPGY